MENKMKHWRKQQNDETIHIRMLIMSPDVTEWNVIGDDSVYSSINKEKEEYRRDWMEKEYFSSNWQQFFGVN